MAETSTPDVPLLRKVVEWVEEQNKLPEIDRTWLQRTWRAASEYYALHLAMTLSNVSPDECRQIASTLEPHCGTAYCAAGYVAHLDGVLSDDCTSSSYIVMPNHPDADEDGEISISTYAQERLGLTDNQATLMFNGANTAADVRKYAEAAAGESL